MPSDKQCAQTRILDTEKPDVNPAGLLNRLEVELVFESQS